jgi:haloacid dehalogenase superfamily, subfamily IA, variant 3 with third motif having DD or ED/haloacid dehalogenase superfamily, subfamily IA, variant 1 with third motif having Dx(3-4)D or Dx(3-4)E
MTSGHERRRAVFFDLDDTLYDQLEPFRTALRMFGGGIGGISADALYRRFRHHSDALWEPYRSGSMPLEEMRVERIRRALADFGFEAEAGDCARFQEAYQDGQYRIRLLPGAEACLAELEAAGCLLGVVTNGPGPHQARKLEALGIERFIPRHRWFISGEIGAAKPDPALFAHVNRATGTQPEASVLVGDSPVNDVKGAAEAGWRTVWFNARGGAAGPQPEADLTAGGFAGLARRIIGLLA